MYISLTDTSEDDPPQLVPLCHRTTLRNDIDAHGLPQPDITTPRTNLPTTRLLQYTGSTYILRINY
jgi:hypothetical protein